MARVGVDVGGTNTDFVLEAEHGVYFHKVASTPHDQSEGVLKGLAELCDRAGIRPNEIELIVHGTTVATNITLEHDGAEVGMITTRNFRDILPLEGINDHIISRFILMCLGRVARSSSDGIELR